MKTTIFSSIITILAVWMVAVMPVQAQGKHLEPDQIAYMATAGVYAPVGGISNQLTASIDYDDTTGVINAVKFDVYLYSFLNSGTTYNYNLMALIGAANYFPDMTFESKSVEQNGDDMTIKGSLYLRGLYRPVTIHAKRNNDNNTITLQGDFIINTRDYYPFIGSLNGYPSYVNLSFHMLFDTSEKVEG